MIKLLQMNLISARDIVRSRQRARMLAALMGFRIREQTQISTAVSEITRNALQHGMTGQVFFSFFQTDRSYLIIEVIDKGPGIEDVNKVLMHTNGSGLKACFRLMDECEIIGQPGKGTHVSLKKYLPNEKRLSEDHISAIVQEMQKAELEEAIEDRRLGEQDLLTLIDESRLQHEQLIIYQSQLEELNKELADTNRGVIALNTELENQATTIKEAIEVKEKFLSHITHELRTPLNSILSMTKILSLNEGLSVDGRKQMEFIISSAIGLSEMVNDLLDNVKANSGQWELENGRVNLNEVFSMLKAMFKPLMPSDTPIDLVFQDCGEIPDFISDEVKLNQILRNFISNAIKFTEQGQVTVSADRSVDGRIRISVQDSGIGIAPEHQAYVFEDFVQVRSAQQKRAKGTGLGLPLARKLSQILKGYIELKSEIGKGSIFTLDLPFSPALENAAYTKKVLVIDDDAVSYYINKYLFKNLHCEFVYANTGLDGIALAKSLLPDLIMLDFNMPGLNGFETLEKLRGDPDTKSIPVALNSSMRMLLDNFPLDAPRPDLVFAKEDFDKDSVREEIYKLLGYGERPYE